MFDNEEISDYRYLKAIRHRIDTLEFDKKLLLNSVYHCGSKVVGNDAFHSVALVANKKTARFYGNTSCKSPWCCPVCTARKMAKYASKMSAALDALKGTHNAAMITFTIPHLNYMTCEEVTEILYNTWKAFVVHGNKLRVGSKNDIFSKFMESTESSHRVRVTEYTWGKNGWHPHFHCLFWFPKKHWDEILSWEAELSDRWLTLAERYTNKQLLKRFSKEQAEVKKKNIADQVATMFKETARENKGVWISKENGKPIIQKSSMYLCGWGADKETTGNYKQKACAEGHYTWQQILAKAADENDEKFWRLFFEYAIATRKARHARVNFSVHSGLCKIIVEHQNSEGFKEILKKKNTELEDKVGKWQLVCWFTKKSWEGIYYNDLQEEILNFGLNGEIEKIDSLLAQYDLPKCIPKNEAPEVKLMWLEVA